MIYNPKRSLEQKYSIYPVIFFNYDISLIKRRENFHFYKNAGFEFVVFYEILNIFQLKIVV